VGSEKKGRDDMTAGTHGVKGKRRRRPARSRRKRRLPKHHAIAFREAGHAVAAWERGVMLMPVSIFAFGKGAGRNVWNNPLRNVDFDWVRSAGSPGLARRLASILLAGPMAETLFGPKLPKGTASVERLRDARTLLIAAARDTNGGRRHVEKARAEMEKFLKQPRVKEAVTALAAALVDRGTIRGGEAASIIETHIDL
jgi:hypothetical protein